MCVCVGSTFLTRVWVWHINSRVGVTGVVDLASTTGDSSTDSAVPAAPAPAPSARERIYTLAKGYYGQFTDTIDIEFTRPVNTRCGSVRVFC